MYTLRLTDLGELVHRNPLPPCCHPRPAHHHPCTSVRTCVLLYPQHVATPLTVLYILTCSHPLLPHEIPIADVLRTPNQATLLAVLRGRMTSRVWESCQRPQQELTSQCVNPSLQVDTRFFTVCSPIQSRNASNSKVEPCVRQEIRLAMLKLTLRLM